MDAHEHVPQPSDDGAKSQHRVALGIAFGLPFGGAVGMLFFDNLVMGAGIGLVVGIVIGAALAARQR